MIDVTVLGEEQVQAMLAQWTDPKLTERAKRATKKGANLLKAPLKAAVQPLSKRMAASVYVHIAKRDKPAHVVGHHKRIAFFWHMVIGGTKDHSLRKRKQSVREAVGTRTERMVRGVKPHPVVAAVGAAYGERVFQVVIDDLSKDE